MSTVKSFSSRALGLFVTAAAGFTVGSGSAPVTAAELMATESTAQSAPSSAGVQRPIYTAVVNVSGTVSDSPESVDFRGRARVSSRLAPDPDFGSPHLLLMFDLSDVSGVGSLTRNKYVVPTPEIVQRRLAANHDFQVNFPYVEADGDPLSARTALVAISLTIDVDTGAITAGGFSILTPNF